MSHTYTITTDHMEDFDLAPASVYHEIYQNVRYILATPKSSMTLDRKFGINAQVVDMPIAKAKAVLSSEIIDAIEFYEPRAIVEEITFTEDIDGKLMPKVRISINEELV